MSALSFTTRTESDKQAVVTYVTAVKRTSYVTHQLTVPDEQQDGQRQGLATRHWRAQLSKQKMLMQYQGLEDKASLYLSCSITRGRLTTFSLSFR